MNCHLVADEMYVTLSKKSDRWWQSTQREGAHEERIIRSMKDGRWFWRAKSNLFLIKIDDLVDGVDSDQDQYLEQTHRWHKKDNNLPWGPAKG